MAELITAITPFIQAYGVTGVLLVAFLEEIIAPLPSLFSLMAAGYFLVPADAGVVTVALQTFLKVALPTAVGLTSGAFLVYAALYFGGEPFVRRWGKWMGLSWEKIEKVEARFVKGSINEWVIFGLRVVPFVPNVAVSAACGLFRYPVRNFLILTFLGGAVRAFLMGLLGWAVGAAYAQYAGHLEQMGLVGGAVFLVLAAVAVGLGLNHARKRRARQ
jgi:membrane protein DedA with SNARE-associated domain